jgi:hypothetical protein
MHLPPSVAFASALVVLIGALLLIIAAIVNRPWLYAHWVRISFWMIGLSGVAWAALKLVMLVKGHSLSYRAYLTLDHYRTLAAGMGLGLLALFFLSGEAVAGIKKWRELKRSRDPNA